jgi:hypothetical protein
MKKIFILNSWLFLQSSIHPAQAPIDEGHLFRVGNQTREQSHWTRDSVEQLTINDMRDDTILSAETDDSRDPNEQESRIALIQKDESGKWLVDFATIQPQTFAFTTKEKAQAFTLNFLTQSSQDKKEQEIKDKAKRINEKRQRLKTQKYRIGNRP